MGPQHTAFEFPSSARPPSPVRPLRRERALALLALLLITVCDSVRAVEPPGPWEAQNAILSADTIVRGTMEGDDQSASRAAGGPGAGASLKLKVIEVLRDEPGTVRPGSMLMIVLPSSELDAQRSRFKPGAEIVAALAVAVQEPQYRPSTEWPHLSLLVADRTTRAQVTNWLAAYPFSRLMALRAALDHFEVPQSRLKASIIGGHVQGDQFRYTKDPAAAGWSLIWQVWPAGSGQNRVYLDARTGQPLTPVK